MSKFEALVRARIAKTGESWSTASGRVADYRRKVARERKTAAVDPPAPKIPFESQPFVYEGSAESPDGEGMPVFGRTPPNAMGPFLRGGDVGATEALLEADERFRSVEDSRVAVDRVVEHLLRWPVSGHEAITGHGKVADVPGGVQAGARFWRDAKGYHLRATEVVGGFYSWDELFIPTEGILGFAAREGPPSGGGDERSRGSSGDRR